MTILSTRTHGYMDYAVGILLIISPWLFQFDQSGPAATIPIVLGVGTIVYSLLTNYELGAARVISMPAHLWLDGLAGLFLAVSPWLFNFADLVFLPHLILGVMEVGTAMMTDSTPHITYTKKPVA